ncbi:6-carboxytetrahydropterin synthase QueD [bacterium]|nr:6-carboxytetrahydropterin synthase QueD [bacterium]
MYRTFIETRFSAAHRINGYQGQCGKLHGHTWKVRVQVRTGGVNNIGISIDFKELRSLTEAVLENLDHQLINEISPFDKENPTAENLAKYICHEVSGRLPETITMDEVTVWESDNYAVIFSDS